MTLCLAGRLSCRCRISTRRRGSWLTWSGGTVRRGTRGRRGGGGGGGQAAREGEADGPRADRAAGRRGVVHRVRRAGPSPRPRLRDRGQPPVRGRGGDRD